MDIVNQLDENLWREFVDDHPLGNIFHTPEMFSVFSRAKYHQPELWAVLKHGRILALFLPVSISMISGPLQIFTTRNIVYGSVLCTPDKSGYDALNRLLAAYRQRVKSKALFSELRNLNDLSQLRSQLSEQGFLYEDHLNYLIDLNRPSELIFESIKPKTRKAIRRGLSKEKVIVKEIDKKEHIAECYELLQKTYQNAQVPLADYSLFEAAFDVLHPKDMIRFSIARVDNVPAAVSVELLYKEVMYGWYGGMDRNFSAHTPNEILMWDILQWGAEHNYHVYDFGGAGTPDENYGVRDFKAKFGGMLVGFGRFRLIHSPMLLNISKFIYNQYRKFI